MASEKQPFEKKNKMNDKELRKKFGWRKARKVKAGKWIEEDGGLYDLDLWWSLFLNSKRDILIAVALLFVSCKFMLPLSLISVRRDDSANLQTVLSLLCLLFLES